MKKGYWFLIILFGLLTIFLVFLFFNKDNTPSYSIGNKDKKEQENNLNNNLQETMELKIDVLKEGTGEEKISNGQTAVVHYTGWLTDGTKFDSSLDRNQTFEFVLGSHMVIAGWDQGVLGMSVGEKRKLTIPSDLAYGDNGIPGAIPGGATLIFEVELIDIK